MTTGTVESLRQHAFFGEFQPRHMEKLLMLGSEVRFESGQIIFREAEESNLFYIILSGRVALEATAGGETVLIQTLFPGDELGWSAVLSHRRHFQARALDPVEVMAFDIPSLKEACQGNPYFGYAFLGRLFAAVADRLEATRRQLVAALAEQRK